MIVDDRDYGEIRDGRDAQRIFEFEIDPDFAGNLITLTLTIEGDVDGDTEELGTEEIIIPVGNTQ